MNKVRPGYKQTEVGVIPEEWDSMTCAELCVKIQDGTHFSPKIRGHDYLYLTSKNIRFGFLDISTADKIDAAQHESIYKRCDVKHGDLLLTKDGANTGNAALNTLTEQFSLLSSVAFLRFDAKKHSVAYFLQQCLSEQGQQRMKDAMSGNAITRLTLEKIRKLRFPVAPLPEQRAIAAALSDVDALLGGLVRLIAKKRDLKQAAMQQLLTGQTRLPGFSGEWEVKRLGDCLVARPDYGINAAAVAYSDRLPTYIRITDITDDGIFSPEARVSVSHSEAPRYYLNEGDLLFARTGASVGKSYLYRQTDGPLVFAGFLIRVQPDPAQLVPAFLFSVTQTSEYWNWVRQMSMRSGQPGINGNEYAELPLSLPSLPEQTAIATLLSDMDAELAALEARRDKTRALKQAMMQELLTGRTRLVSPEVAHA